MKRKIKISTEDSRPNDVSNTTERVLLLMDKAHENIIKKNASYIVEYSL